MSSYLGGGVITLDRWEGLKEWHRRHQDLLGDQKNGSDLEGFRSQSQSSIPTLLNEANESNTIPYTNLAQNSENSDLIDLFLPPSAKHDLSIIPEGDEDSRSRDGGDLDSFKFKQPFPKNSTAQKADINPKSGNLNMPAKASKASVGQSASLQDSTQVNAGSTVVKRPFLRRGQGLAKYNLKPEDLKNPYKRGSAKNVTSKEKDDRPKANTFAKRQQTSNKVDMYSTERPASQQRKTSSLEIPMQRLVLSVPTQKSQSVEIGTWSQVFGGEGQITSEAGTDIPRQPNMNPIPPLDAPKYSAMQLGSRFGNLTSPARRLHAFGKADSSPEEDQDSLAAYLDLEQHVGNASFCSTSSKVDRLVAKSSKPVLHQSNPDAITQSKQLTPVKTGRKFMVSGRDRSLNSEDNPAMWSVADIENLLKARARRSGSLIKSHLDPVRNDLHTASSEKMSPAELPVSEAPEKDLISFVESDDSKSRQEDIDWMLEELGPVRKPHLMKTMPSIDLDSSLIKNALAPTPSHEESDSESESESSTSDSSSEEESEDDLTLNSPSKEASPEKPFDARQPTKEVTPNPCGPIKLVDDSTLQEINYQIESHLGDLRKEIETLQSAKGKTQKYMANLEKKVQELEHRLILDARTFNKRLEEEREAAAKRLSEEQSKFQKEKQSLQRTLREERKKGPDPITQQEVLRLKQQVAEWEEKWRSDRAKARGLESNLRIQLTNIKRENEKLKEENNKLRREKETAFNTAKAKASSNTRVINSIAQQLGTTKPKVTIVREENHKQRKQTVNSAYNLKSMQMKGSKPLATIENFPRIPHAPNEWSSDEEIDLGKESSDEEDIMESVEAEIVQNKTQLPSILRQEVNSTHSQLPEQEIMDLEEAQAKYDAIFGKEDMDSGITKSSSKVIENIQESSNRVPSETKSSGSEQIETEKYVKSIHHPDGTLEQVKENGTRVVTLPDGTWRRHSSSGSVMTVPPSGWPIQISYFNGDQLEKLNDGRTRYFYAKTNIWQTSYPDGHEELQYPSGQIERREPDGSVRVLIPGSNGNSSKVQGPDGISIEKLSNGDTVILLPTGERELHTQEYMKKEFLDGTIKYMYKNGSQETQYPSGRIRIKDPQGNLIKDTGMPC